MAKEGTEKTTPIHAGHRQRVKERFLKEGLDAFAPHEILEMLLFFGIPTETPMRSDTAFLIPSAVFPGCWKLPTAN